MDVEILRLLRRQFTPLDVDEDALAFEAHDEVRHGGHFLGAMHTLQRFRDCFYRPMLASTDNFERWTSRGGLDTAARAGMLWRAAIEGYVQPDLDPTVHADLVGYAARRRHELGDD
jgi:trimethylamine--corrinoid protein Co-methyltransferase